MVPTDSYVMCIALFFALGALMGKGFRLYSKKGSIIYIA